MSILHRVTDHTRNMESPNAVFIDNLAKLQSITENVVLIINCEQTFSFKGESNCSRSSLQGIELAKYLRRVEKKNNPIIFTSFLSPNFILSRPNTHILKAVGHDYLQLPFSDEAFKEKLASSKALNDIQLKDIILNFCQLRSSVREGFHAFKGRIRALANSGSTDKPNLLRDEFDKYENELKKDVGDYPEIIKEYRRVVGLYDPNKENSIEIVLAVQEENFIGHLPADEASPNESPFSEKPWKVLFLDDKPEELEAVFAALRQRKIKYKYATTVKEARKIVDNDTLNEFAVVVSDYRLLEQSKGWNESRMQQEQGYDFLLWLAKQDRYNAMIALSGLSKWFLMDSFRQHQVNVKVYSKNGLLGGGVKLFVDDLEYHGERIFETLISIPTASEWGKQLKNYYKWLRLECTDVDGIERYVSSKAEEIIEQLDRQLAFVKDKKYLNLQDKMGMASGALPEYFDSTCIDLFKIKLAYRRVLIYYCIMGTLDGETIAKILMKGSEDADKIERNNRKDKNKAKDDDSYGGMKKFVFNQQALKESDIPFNLLIEEKLWLKNKMGMEIINAQVQINQLHELLHFFFRTAHEKIPNLKTLPSFEDAFSSGKSTTAINKDLQYLLKQLHSSNPSLLNELLKKLQPVISEISGFIYPKDSYKLIQETINQYLIKR